MSPLVPGYQVANGLVLVRHLGQGGMGSVWIAKHDKLDIEVVVKFLSESLVDDADALARFEREVSSMSMVKSPHVVQPLDHGVSSTGIPYIVMELLEGEDLASTLRERGKLSPGEVMHVVDGIASALTKAHERSIIHRDIKPSNVFLCTATPRPFVKVVDFGISKRLGDPTLTATNGFIGTPAYMSPEQIAGGAVDARTDIWALGVLAYTSLTGTPPFTGDNLASIVHAVTTTRPAPPTSHDPSLPAAVDAWASRALARNRADRFSSTQELADALANALGESVRARPASVTPPPPPRFFSGAKGAEATHTFTGTGPTVLEAVSEATSPPRRSTKWVVVVGVTAVAASLVTAGVVHRSRGPSAQPTAASSGAPIASASLPPVPSASPSAVATSAPMVSAAVASSTPAPRSHAPSRSTAGRERPTTSPQTTTATPPKTVQRPDDIGF